MLAEKDKVHTMEKAALQKEKDLDQCKVCPYSIYDYVYVFKVDIYRSYCILTNYFLCTVTACCSDPKCKNLALAECALKISVWLGVFML